jgi:transcriptional regulator with XRE-family HTH domain
VDASAKSGSVDARDADLGREGVILLPVFDHPVSENAHPTNVRSSYIGSQAACTIIGWPVCTITDQSSPMAGIPQGELLRQWRERKGMSLEAAAFAVELLARTAGVDAKSKKIPRTHASLSRWETGKVEVKDLGLALLAEAYGVDPEDLRRPPPPENRPQVKRVDVPAEHEASVKAFLEALERKAS